MLLYHVVVNAIIWNYKIMGTPN